MKTMAEVLAEHQLDVTVYLITDAEYLCICGKRSTCHENHQEDALSAAGYGPVREAQAEAWAAGYDKGTDLAAWAIGNRPQSERPDTSNPYGPPRES